MLRRALQQYPRLPKGLRTIPQLKAAERRPSNLFRADAYVLGPPQLVTIPGPLLGTGRTGPGWRETLYPPSPVYREDRAIAFSTRPHPDDAQAARRAATQWAQDVLVDPDTVILAVSALGSPAPTTPPLERATPYEIALTSAHGRKRWLNSSTLAGRRSSWKWAGARCGSTRTASASPPTTTVHLARPQGFPRRNNRNASS